MRDSVRNLGLGSQLLKQVVHYYPDHLRGTSFGYSPELHKFWHANHYQPIRLGTHVDAASGLPSAVYIERTSIRNPQLAAQLHTAHCVLLLTLPFMPVMRFMQKTLQQCSDEFDLAASTDQINTADRQAATQAMQTSYQAFANGIIPYDFVHAIIAYGLHNGLFRGEAEDIAFVNQVNGYQDLAKAALALNFDGKKATRTAPSDCLWSASSRVIVFNHKTSFRTYQVRFIARGISCMKLRLRRLTAGFTVSLTAGIMVLAGCSQMSVEPVPTTQIDYPTYADVQYDRHVPWRAGCRPVSLV